MKKNLSKQLRHFDPLLHKVLASQHISVDHLFYDDYLQQLRIALWTKLEQHSLEESSYLFRWLVWQLKDCQRENWQQLRIQQKLNWQNPRRHYSIEEDLLYATEFLDDLVPLLTVAERDFLRLRLRGKTFQEIADALGKSRKTMYYYQKRIQEKFRKLLKIG
ncbi:RNA polymerase sigma factor (sigma-70 family) [Enterococcus sp. PF1-24]|uniref:sigma-70 family RNA polymerase sigma factor n=1 Tax=unclassified Enterococcus TaxID=2608891 RepID=UPI002475F32D|nr:MULTISPECIES: sigma-70 family RNA polymerase sigma factor [unclassified Enterococcus]MDH6365642.1 RNA polymerase sigma factor (sigma-70 family) [Enterococcus sp. PFB1-1]MDH6402743.1 RNA polymerase sigma factor (sigma-70 family) [Enterococcus sp. PF1-24]